MINNFDCYFNNFFIVINGGAELEIIDDSKLFFDKKENQIAKIKFLSNYTYPHFEIHEPCPDWSEYSSFSFDVYNDKADTIDLYLRIEDSSHNFKPDDRYNGSFKIISGLNNISIDFDLIKKAPGDRELDMIDIRAIQFFMISPEEEIKLYFDNIELTKL